MSIDIGEIIRFLPTLVLVGEPRIVRCGLPRFRGDLRKFRHGRDDIGHCLTSHKLFNL